MPAYDVFVLGAGPAGLAAASALVARGLRVAVAAPDLPQEGPPSWRPTYCAWEDELEPDTTLVTDRWASVVATFGSTRSHTLARPYVRLDKRRLAEHLCAPFTRVCGRVVAAAHGPSSSRVTLADGATFDATVVIDAAGTPALLAPGAGPAPAWQTAVGRTLAPRAHPWPTDRAVLMDYDPAPLGEDPTPPSFLYVLPRADGTVFVEETVLAARPAVSEAVLAARLDRRLAALGVSGEVLDTEWVAIPMGGELPHDPRVLGFGAAAGMIHPASGYLLPRVLARAGPLADVLAATLGAGAPPEAAVAAAWAVVWPRERRAARAHYRFGLEALLGMEPAELRRFFDTFFQLPPEDWAGWLSDRHAPADVRRVMWAVFADAPWRLRWSLARAGFGREGWEVARATLGLDG